MTSLSVSSPGNEEKIEPRRMKWRRHTHAHTAPPSMKNHTSTLFRNELIVFGGFDGATNNNRVHAMNVETGEWKVIDNVEGVSPTGRNGHTATLANGKIFYIGGWLGTGPLGAADVHTLDPVTWTWARVTTTGKGPGPCNMHTADYIELNPDEKFIFLFRGGDGHSYLNDLHVLDVERLSWRHPQTKGRPPAPRANHSSAVYNKQLIIFGGWDGTSRLHDLHILDAVEMTWSCPDTKGIPPTPRAGSTLTCIGDGLILFGGSGPHSSCFNDVHFFDPKTLTWTKAEKDLTLTNGVGANQIVASKRVRVTEQRDTPGDDNPNVQHQSSTIAPMLRIQGEAPEKRAGHTATLVGNRRLLIVGGSFQTEYLKTVYELDIDPPPQLTLQTPSPSLALIKGVEQFGNSEELSDVVFIVENQPVYCHRLILATQSEWFRVMFSRGFKESTEKQITLDNVPLAVFKQMIAFFYLGERAIPLLLANGSNPSANVNEVSDNSASAASFVLDAYDDSLENSQDSEVMFSASAVTSPTAYMRRLASPEAATSSTTQFAIEDQERSAIASLCELLIVADQFMCEHLRERCELTLARMVNVRNVKQLLVFARNNRAETLVSVCEHFEKWGGN